MRVAFRYVQVSNGRYRSALTQVGMSADSQNVCVTIRSNKKREIIFQDLKICGKKLL